MTKRESALSRRNLLKKAGTGAGLLGLSAAPSMRAQANAAGQGTGRPRALALIGDRYHNPDYIRVSLDKIFKSLEIPIDYTIQYDRISKSTLKG
jgi:hypothetical protein